MPIIKSLVDLFRRGASYIAEQFVRGNTRSPTLTGLLERKFGDDLQAAPNVISQLQSRVLQASEQANILQRGQLPRQANVPLWEGGGFPQQFIESGLAKIEIANVNTGERIRQWSPFSFNLNELEKVDAIIKRLAGAIEANPSYATRYDAKLDKLEQIRQYLLTNLYTENIGAELFGVYRSHE